MRLGVRISTQMDFAVFEKNFRFTATDECLSLERLAGCSMFQRSTTTCGDN